MLKEQCLLYSPADGIWSRVGGSGRSDHSIVINGDVVVLEDRRGTECTWTDAHTTATVDLWLTGFLTNIPGAT